MTIELKIPLSAPSSQPVCQSPTASWHSWPPRPQHTLSVCDGRAPPPAGPVDWWWVWLHHNATNIFITLCFDELWLLMLEELRLSVTNDIVVEAELAGLTGFEDLHSDELDLCFAVLKHLLCCCKQFPVLWSQQHSHRTEVMQIQIQILCDEMLFDRKFPSSCFLFSLHFIRHSRAGWSKAKHIPGTASRLTDCEKERLPFTSHFQVDISPCLISHRAALCFRPVNTPHPDGVCVCVVRGYKLTVSTTPVAKPLRKAAL